MCEFKRNLTVRILPFLVAFSLGLGAAIYLGSYSKDLVIKAVRQKKVLVDTQVVSVPDVDLPALLQKLPIKSVGTKVRATVGVDGRVISVTPEHTLYINADQSRPNATSLADKMMLQNELEYALSRQVEGTVFAVGADEANKDVFEVVVTGNFVTPAESSNGCGEIVLTFDSGGRILWQGDTARGRHSVCSVSKAGPIF
ncbi:MAG TPA: hypothetical protein VFD63_26215 [Pyrinomonadaceae bacterium]|jgi:hypothetical protein|nr:hypothetical protein [Pyrinomonadaceae bacterium]